MRRARLSIREMVLFSLFGAMMFATAQIDTVINVHQNVMFIAILTVVYRSKALIPLYIYVFLEGLFGGFGIHWWPAYLYIWLFSWALIMLIPKGTKEWAAAPIISIISALHGLLFGVMYAPYHCLAVLKGDFSQMLPWIIAGIPTDISHMIGNLIFSIPVLPLVRLLCRLEKKKYPFARKK